MKQRSISNMISASGVGLHSGKKVNLLFKPAPENTGIVFIRTDLAKPEYIVASAENVQSTSYCTTIGNGKATVSTIEHVMSALAGLGIDNIFIELDGPEVPIMDGSSSPFIFLLESSGVRCLSADKRFIVITESIKVEDGDKTASIEPYKGFKLDFKLDYDHPAIPSDSKFLSVNFTDSNYIKEVSRARTYGFLHEYEWLKNNNLALGGSLNNAIVFDKYSILNKDGLRYANELVRHKILDAVGDLYLLGDQLIGYFKGFKSGHALNNLLVNKILEQKNSWKYATFPDQKEIDKYGIYPEKIDCFV